MMFRQCLVRALFLGILLVLGVPSQWARADVITSGDTGTPNVNARLIIGNTADGTMTIDGGSSVASPDGGGVGLTEGVIVFRDRERFDPGVVGWLAAYDKKTGKRQWRKEWDNTCCSYTTPILYEGEAISELI